MGTAVEERRWDTTAEISATAASPPAKCQACPRRAKGNAADRTTAWLLDVARRADEWQEATCEFEVGRRSVSQGQDSGRLRGAGNCSVFAFRHGEAGEEQVARYRRHKAERSRGERQQTRVETAKMLEQMSQRLQSNVAVTRPESATPTRINIPSPTPKPMIEGMKPGQTRVMPYDGPLQIHGLMVPRAERPSSSKASARCSLTPVDITLCSSPDSPRTNLGAMRVAPSDYLTPPQRHGAASPMPGNHVAFSHFVECMRQRRSGAKTLASVQRGGLRLATAPRTIPRPPSSGLHRRPLTPSAMTVTFDMADFALPVCRRATAPVGPAHVVRRHLPGEAGRGRSAAGSEE